MKIGAWLVAEDRDEAYDGTSEADNPMRERTRIMVPLLTLDVRVTDQFGLQAAASVPDVTRSALVPRPTGAIDFKETFSGFGDTSVLGWYKLRPMRGWYTVLNAGASLPTGRTETPRFREELEAGSLVPMSRLQRGIGHVRSAGGTERGAPIHAADGLRQRCRADTCGGEPRWPAYGRFVRDQRRDSS